MATKRKSEGNPSLVREALEEGATLFPEPRNIKALSRLDPSDFAVYLAGVGLLRALMREPPEFWDGTAGKIEKSLTPAESRHLTPWSGFLFWGDDPDPPPEKPGYDPENPDEIPF